MLNTDLSHMLLEFTDIELWCNEFAIWGSLFTESRPREGLSYSANHVSRDHWRHSQSSSDFANSSRFTGSPVRGSLPGKYPHPVWVFSEVFWMDGSKHNISTCCSRSLSRIYSNPNTKVIFHCIIILYVTSLLINQQWGKAYFRVEHMLPSL